MKNTHINRTTSLREVAERRQKNHRQHTKEVCNAMLKNLDQFLQREATVADITAEQAMAFARYLQERVSPASARTYLQKLHAIAEDCVDQHYLPYNPMPAVRRMVPYVKPVPRTFLTVDEVLSLSVTDCPNRQVKLAFLFACTTGLRLSDIETLRWEHIIFAESGRTIVKEQEKTRREVRVPLGESACTILHQLGAKTSGPVFNIPSRSTVASVLRCWADAAAINKRLTFHVSRHSFATMLISADVSIFTVSKLCGHANVRTTELYAHVLDKTLRDGIVGIDRLMQGSYTARPASSFAAN
ncbi:MAG: site-specific integrase [Bacteroidales bacterium]|nr:site-specific integrase [Bacteroidales bacterium]